MNTPFGRLMRERRLESGKTLFDVAGLISYSSAFLSGVETGKKQVPAGFAIKVSAAMNLSPSQTLELIEAEKISKNIVYVDLSNVNDSSRELAFAFARNFKDLDDEKIKRLIGMLGDN